MQAEILRRLVIGYTKPGDQVAVVTGRAARPALAVAENGRRLLAVVPDRRAARDLSGASRKIASRRRVEVRVGLPADLDPPARLVVLTSLSRTTLQHDGPLVAAARLLRPDGVLAIVARQHANRRRIDGAPDAIIAAEAAGLTYVQHIVALTRPIRGSRLVHSHALSDERTLVHADVLVFARIADGER